MLPQKIWELSSLTCLRLERFPRLLSLDSQLVTAMPQLETLDLTECTELTGLPPTLFEMRALRSVILCGCCSLVRVPDLPELPDSLQDAPAKGESDDAETDGSTRPPISAGGGPPLPLRLLDLSGCEALYTLPDLSVLGPSLEVLLERCNEKLVAGWMKGGRKAFNAAFV